MKYRVTTLLAEENLGTSGTKTIDVNIKDVITALQFQTRITFSTGARLVPEPDVFSKIELVDGSDVLMSLSGTEMAALSFYEGNKQIDWAATNLVSSTEEGYLKVCFGRFLRDPELAFDPTKYRNPQLKVTFNAATVQAAATPVYLRVNAVCFDEKAVSPVGFLRLHEFNSYTGSASAYKYIDLPTDQVIRKLYLQTKYFGGGHFQLLTSAKLSEDNDKRIPFDLLCRDWMNLDLAEFGRCHQYGAAYGNGTSYPVWAAPCNVENGSLMNCSRQEAPQCVYMTGGKYAYDTAITTSLLIGEFSGALPYFVYCFPFGNQMDMDDWYDATRVGSLVFRVYSGTLGASGTYNTILQQLVRY